ncbi:MAG: hypothetical protein U0892_06465 [Pirellulales bacterium]
MGQEKKDEKPPEPPPPTRWEILSARLKALPGAGLAFALIPLLIIGYFGWYYWGAEHLDQTLYALRAENIELTQQPEWIKGNVRDEVYQNGSLNQISLLDPQASATIAHAFDAHICVKNTRRVRKLGGGKVQVDVQYRMPAAMVYFERKSAAGDLKRGCIPVDDESVALPKEGFTSEQVVRDYFRIYAVGATPPQDIGMPFGDMRIVEALKLCKLLSPVRTVLKLEEIYVDQDQPGGPSPWILRILTDDKRQIIWGHAPGDESVGEPRVELKISMMERWLRSGVDPAGGTVTRNTLDLRNGPTAQLTRAQLP